MYNKKTPIPSESRNERETASCKQQKRLYDRSRVSPPEDSETAAQTRQVY